MPASRRSEVHQTTTTMLAVPNGATVPIESRRGTVTLVRLDDGRLAPRFVPDEDPHQHYRLAFPLVDPASLCDVPAQILRSYIGRSITVIGRFLEDMVCAVAKIRIGTRAH